MDLIVGVLVAEPTRKGLSVYRQWQGYAVGYDVAVVLAGNKVQTGEDVEFLRQHAGDDLLTWLGYEPAVRAMEQGRGFSLTDLTGKTRAALAVLHDAPDAQPKDWQTYARHAVEFHLKNARAWASAAAGQDLTAQVDSDFTLMGCPGPSRKPGR